MSPPHTLVLMRHAKAQRPEVADIERALTDRGHADASAAGAWLAGQGYLPDLVICSPARRTRQTWHGVALVLGEAGARGQVGTRGQVGARGQVGTRGQAGADTAAAGSPEVRYERRAYDGGAADLLDLIRAADDHVGTLLMIGHNPSVSELSLLLDPESGRDSDGLRTGGMAVHTVATTWAECGPKGAPRVTTHTARA